MLSHLFSHIAQGGLIMLPIALLAIALWWLVFLKSWEIWILIKNEVPVKAGEYAALPQQDIAGVSDDALYGKECWQKPLAQDYLNSRSGNEELDEELSRVLIDRHAGYIEKGIATIIVLAATAPLLGLLGTVSGMVDTFDVISQFGTGNAKGLASGISQALITTQSGLIVAIPGMIAGGLLYRRANKIKNRMMIFLNNLERTKTDKETAI